MGIPTAKDACVATELAKAMMTYPIGKVTMALSANHAKAGLADIGASNALSEAVSQFEDVFAGLFDD